MRTLANLPYLVIFLAVLVGFLLNERLHVGTAVVNDQLRAQQELALQKAQEALQ